MGASAAKKEGESQGQPGLSTAGPPQELLPEPAGASHSDVKRSREALPPYLHHGREGSWVPPVSLTDELQLTSTSSSQAVPGAKGCRGCQAEGLASRLFPLGQKAMALLVWP